MKNMGRLLALIVAVVAVALSVTAGNAANAANAKSVYTHTEIIRCQISGRPTNGCIDIFTNATYSGTQIWVNGNVQCIPTSFDGKARTTWCGVGGGNGTATLDVGANWTDSEGNFYQRVNIPANGNTGISGNWPATNNGKGCSSNGSNTDEIWQTPYFVCNNLGAGSPQG